MSFQLFSDIHLEFKTEYPRLVSKCDNLILAGDIAPLTNSLLKDFLIYCSQNWKHIFYICGNHEYYVKYSIESATNYFINFIKDLPNIHFLNNSYFELDGIVIYGSILWTRPIFDNSSKARFALNDYNKIKTKNGKLTVEDVKKSSEDGVIYLKEFLQINQLPTIIVTHFPPISKNTSDPKYEGDYLQDYFRWENIIKSENLKSNNIKVWCSGHVHYEFDFIDNGIRYIGNQIGYDEEKLVWNDGLFHI